MDYLTYWKLKDKPFEDTRNTKFFFPGENHSAALTGLLYLTQNWNMNFGLLTGESGSGKTMIRTILEHRLHSENFKVVSLENSYYPFHHLLMKIINQLAGKNMLDKASDEYHTMNMFKELLFTTVIEHHLQLVILLDETHQLRKECLAKLKNLTDIDSEEENFISIILFGQPELKSLIRSIPQLDQRVSVRFHLNYLPANEIKDYINHRLSVAGCPNENIFIDKAIEYIYEGTRGIPREINRIARIALDHARSLGLQRVTESIIRDVLKDINLQSAISEDPGKTELFKKKPFSIKSLDRSLVPNDKIESKKKGESFFQGTTRKEKPVGKRVLILDDSPMEENLLFSFLVDMGYPTILDKKKDGCVENIPGVADVVLIMFNPNNDSDISLFGQINKLKNIIKIPILWVLEKQNSNLLNKKVKEMDIEVSQDLILFIPFKRQELKNKIDYLYSLRVCSKII